MILVVVAITLAFIGGIVFALTPPSEAQVESESFSQTTKLAIPVAVGVGVFAVLFLLSGWALPAIVVGIGAGIAVSRLQHRDTAAHETEKLEELAAWIESVRDVMLAGEQPLGAIEVSSTAAGSQIRPAVRRLSTSLYRQQSDLAFRRFADDIDDPVADLVATGLAIAVRRGARTVPVLTALAEQTRDQVDRRLKVLAERAPARREALALSLIMGGAVLGLLVFGRSGFLAVYSTPQGQVFLGVALAGYMALLVRVQQLSRFPRAQRFLTARISHSEFEQ